VNHFNWVQLLAGITHENTHIATLLVAIGILLILTVAGRWALGSGEQMAQPAEHFGLKAIFETLTEFIIGLVDMVIGEHGRKLTPMFASIFFFIWINNLLGLVPGMTPATDNFNTTVAVGIFSFLIYNILGFREHGFGYLKHFLGPVIYMAPLMLVIELVSHIVRPFSLGLRLQGNMVGDHTVLSIFLNLAPYGVPVIFYGLGIFVSTMQAFVFTMLSMIYVAMATAHDH
jgi:F-type H+-transporting ATPase subunit a